MLAPGKPSFEVDPGFPEFRHSHGQVPDQSSSGQAESSPHRLVYGALDEFFLVGSCENDQSAISPAGWLIQSGRKSRGLLPAFTRI